MKSWQAIALQLQRQNASFGNQLNFLAIQDSYVSEFIIGIEGTISTAAATAAVEGLSSLVSKVSVSGPLTGYQPLTPINNLSGPMLVEAAQFIRGNVSFGYGSLGSTGNIGEYIPTTFLHPRLPAPWRYMSCLPANLMGSCTINVTMAAQNQCDTNATPTLAFSNLTCFIQQNEYKSNSIPALSPLVPAAQVVNGAFQFIPTTLNYYSQLNPQAGQQNQQLFPNGTYMMFLLRSFASTSSTTRTPLTRQTDAGQVPIDGSITSAGLVLQDVNQSPKSAVTWGTLRKDNLDHVTDSLVPGNVCFQFNRGISDIYQPIVGPNQIPLNYPIVLTGTTLPRVDFVYMQLFDSMNWLGLV